MVESTILQEDEDSTLMSFELSSEEITALIFAGMSEAEPNMSYIMTIAESGMSEDEHKLLAKACADNELSLEEGYRYLQIGIQTALLRGINELVAASANEDLSDSCEHCSTDASKL